MLYMLTYFDIIKYICTIMNWFTGKKSYIKLKLTNALNLLIYNKFKLNKMKKQAGLTS